MTTATIFCDESGYTGPDLLHRQDRFFSYAAVAVAPDEATELVERLITDYNVQAGELKGRQLLKFAKGRRAVTEVFKQLAGRYRTGVYEKRYALACKFYEYIFEPVLSSHSLIFYSFRFHLFIANFLYLHFQQKTRYADEIFAEFQRFMRSFDESQLKLLTTKLELPDRPPALELIAAFTVGNLGAVREEITRVVDTTGKWTLDLSSSALQSLLGAWGTVYDALDVTCDESKPLAASKPTHDSMVGNDTTAYATLFGDDRPMTFNLAKPIQFAPSVKSPGVQLADVVAAATAAIFEHADSSELRAFNEYVRAGLVPSAAVLPLHTEVDLKGRAATRNYLILRDLAKRSLLGQPIIPDAVEYALRLTHEMGLPPPELERAFRLEP